MRRFTFILLAFTLLPLLAFGQIKVNTAGRAFFGSGTGTTSYGAINLTADGTTNGIAFNGANTRYNIFKYNDYLMLSPLYSTTKGLKIGSTGGVGISASNLSTLSTSNALLTFYTTSLPAILLYGDYATSGKELVKAVVDNAYSTNIGFSVYRNDNGVVHERTFYVNGGGTVYAKNGYIQSSDAENKEEVKPLENSLDKISALSAVSFYYKDFAEQTVTSLSNIDIKALKEQSITDSISVYSNIQQETIEKMKSEAYRKRLGLIAQEVEKVVPEVVRTMEDGKKGIMYSDLVSLLIEGIKELKSGMDQQENYIYELEERLHKLEYSNTISNERPLEEATKTSSTQTPEAALFQNRPNPFNQQTEIGYVVPESTSAYIGIYNLNGTQLKKYPLESNSEGVITISASEFTSGMYIYSLIIDNQEIDSRKMILTD